MQLIKQPGFARWAIILVSILLGLNVLAIGVLGYLIAQQEQLLPQFGFGARVPSATTTKTLIIPSLIAATATRVPMISPSPATPAEVPATLIPTVVTKVSETALSPATDTKASEVAPALPVPTETPTTTPIPATATNIPVGLPPVSATGEPASIPILPKTTLNPPSTNIPNTATPNIQLTPEDVLAHPTYEPSQPCHTCHDLHRRGGG